MSEASALPRLATKREAPARGDRGYLEKAGAAATPAKLGCSKLKPHRAPSRSCEENAYPHIVDLH